MPASQHTNAAVVEPPGQSNKRLVACGWTCCSGLCDNLVFAYETCQATVGMLPHKRVHIGVRASTSRHVFRSKAHKRTLHVKSQVEMCLLSPLFALADGKTWCSRMKRARPPEGQCVECVGVSRGMVGAGRPPSTVVLFSTTALPAVHTHSQGLLNTRRSEAAVEAVEKVRGMAPDPAILILS